MFSMKCFQAAAMGLAAVGFGLAPADASAGSCGQSRSYDRGYHGHSSSHVSASYRGGNYRVSVHVGSGRHYDRGHHGHSRTVTYRRTHHQERVYHSAPTRCEAPVVRHVEHRPSGYWTRVYRQPVYETRYNPCGTPYRVCVRSGYYEKVWVSTSHRGY